MYTVSNGELLFPAKKHNKIKILTTHVKTFLINLIATNWLFEYISG